ncbi:MAG: (2Fe-2S)-binding protein [Chloroflexi bacterium]|nr:(2Fe-2S)-binding protein [Chloroflexota bacterium]MBV9595252.1 (2Fe-2S)-binding protein [Chloroflexota bacterium]
MFICICHLVTRNQIESAVHSGAQTVEQVGACNSAGTDCGKCRRNIERILDALKEPHAREPSNH